jgi:hypothetical protein
MNDAISMITLLKQGVIEYYIIDSNSTVVTDKNGEIVDVINAEKLPRYNLKSIKSNTLNFSAEEILLLKDSPIVKNAVFEIKKDILNAKINRFFEIIFGNKEKNTGFLNKIRIYRSENLTNTDFIVGKVRDSQIIKFLKRKTIK